MKADKTGVARLNVAIIQRDIEIDRLRAQVERDRPVIAAARADRTERTMVTRMRLHRAVDRLDAASAPDEVNEAET
jgi:hypothetical protein